jgi:porin
MRSRRGPTPLLALPLALANIIAPDQSFAEQASEISQAAVPLAERPTLFGGPGSPEQWLKDHGVGLDVSLTQFGQAMLSPDEGDNGLQYGGKVNAKVNLDGAKLGLWSGLSASALFEYKYGDSVNGFDGVLLPINTQLYEPADERTAVSLTISQRFNEKVSLTVGKFNMVDAASATPIVGGGGINTFWNLNFAAPPSGMVPPYITGLSLGVNTAPANFSLMVYDPRDSQNSTGLDGWGQDGINTRLAVRFPVKIGGHDGSQTLVGVWSTRDSVDLADLPELVLPPGPDTTVDIKGNSWYLGYNFQQYLWQDSDNPAAGWGLFGQTFIADGNPNLYRWFVNFGIGGTSPIAGRGLDRFGVGYFNTSFSADLTDSLNTILGVDIGDESGIEAFYNAALTPWFRVALDLQYLRPGVRGNDDGFFAGMSAQIKF